MFEGWQIVCSPAGGRDYKSEAEVLADWDAGKDFRMENRPQAYINKRDAENYGVPGGEIKIRFNRKQDACFIKGLKVNDSM